MIGQYEHTIMECNDSCTHTDINQTLLTDETDENGMFSGVSTPQLEVKRYKRKHNKSRDGCLSCKERKIKCDQRIPVCSNCERKGIECPYLMMTPYQIHKIQEHQNRNNREQAKANFSSTVMLPTNSVLSRISNRDDDTESTSASETAGSTTPEDYRYRPSGTIINLNHKAVQTNGTAYHAHEVENALLKCSMGHDFIVTSTDNKTYSYTPLKTNYKPRGAEIPIINNHNGTIIFNAVPLYSNTRLSDRTFNTSHDKTIRYLEVTGAKSYEAFTLLINQDYESLLSGSYGRKLDIMVLLDIVWILSVGQIFDRLSRKSSLLLAMDYYKNTILRQNMVPRCDYKAKLSISCVCENESVISIDEITRILKNQYIPEFHSYSIGARNLVLGSFVILDDCLGYHFKNGLRYSMSFEEGKKALHLVGIFSTGMYAIIIERCHGALLMSSTNIMSANFMTSFKKLLIKNYSLKVLEEFRSMLERVSPFYTNDVNYANIKVFCKEHYKLLQVNLEEHSLFGFSNGYLIRIFNSFKSILPYDLNNLFYGEDSTFEGREADVVINLFYITLSQILDAIIPGVRNLASSTFAGPQMNIFDLDNTANIMRIFHLIKDKRLQIVGIFLIRTALFYKCHSRYFKDFLFDFTIDSVLDEDNDLSINKRYLILRSMKQTGIMHEIPMKTFMLERGQFFRRWNYPNTENLRPTRTDKVSSNKIMNRFNDDEDAMIDNFIRSNNGFFTYDHDVFTEISGDNPVTRKVTYTNAKQMRMLWKLVTYIRINNL